MVGGSPQPGPGPKPSADQRQMKGLSRGFGIAGGVLLALGVAGLFIGGSLSFALAFIGIFFGAMMLISAGVVRFVANQPDTGAAPGAPGSSTKRVASECPKCGGPVGSYETECEWCGTPLV